MLLIHHPVDRRAAQRIVGLLVGAWLSAMPALAQGMPPAEFKRGIAMAHLLAWAPVEPAPSRAFVYPPFAQPTKWLENELKALRRAGFDFVRLAVDPGPFLQFDGSRRDQLDRTLMAYVERILAADLSVIVDFHPSDMQEDYRATALTRGVDTPAFQSYLRLLARTATLLDRLHSRRVALELMNEPPIAPERWQPMLEAAYRTVRDRAPGLLLVLDGGNEGGIEGALALGKFKDDPAALISFHYYDPYQFTHQGASWMAARYLTDVPYPATARPLQDSIDATAATIAASALSPTQKTLALQDARRQLESYRTSSFDRSSIARSFDLVARWARDHGVPANRIILGEFGAKKNEKSSASRSAERARWFRDVREAAEARGFIWAAWVYRGSGGFALVRDEEGVDLDPAIGDAMQLVRK
jgi:endoglucanase